MNQKTIRRFQNQLNGMLNGLEVEVTTTVGDMRGEPALFPDPADRATVESERNLTLRIRDRERKLRNKIEEALERIEDGSFGICETCGDGISVGRLQVRPVTTLCINCKSDQEEDEIRHHQD